MKLDAHPKSMALISIAFGVFGIGVILTIAFWDSDAMLGIGITMAVIGVMIVLLGCISLQSSQAKTLLGDEKKGDMKAKSVAPERIPRRKDLTYRDGQLVSNEEDEDGDGLVYDTFSAEPSPHRTVTFADGTTLGDGDPSQSPDGRLGSKGPHPGSAFVSVTPVADGTAKRMQEAGGPMFPLSPFENRTFPVPDIANPNKILPDGFVVTPARYHGKSPLAMGSDTENTPPPPAAPQPYRSASATRWANSDFGTPRPLPMEFDLPRNTNAPFTTTTTTTVVGSAVRHRFTQQQLDEQAVDFGTPNADDDQLPSGYWTQRSHSARGREGSAL
jgi:hypothetical protein